MKCERLKIAIEEDHEISIGLITNSMASGDRKRIYAGVEGWVFFLNFANNNLGLSLLL